MTRDELIERMRSEGLPLDMVWLQTGVPSECFVIRERRGVWETFYAERGLETGLSAYPTEDAVCQALLNEMRNYAVVSGYVRKPNGN